MTFDLSGGLAEFPLPIPMPHNLNHPHHLHPGLPTEFWPPNFGLHHSLIQPNPALLHQMPNYKLPNFHAILSQYMGLNNLGIFGYSQNLAVNTNRISPDPRSGGSPKDSPTNNNNIGKEVEK